MFARTPGGGKRFAGVHELLHTHKAEERMATGHDSWQTFFVCLGEAEFGLYIFFNNVEQVI